MVQPGGGSCLGGNETYRIQERVSGGGTRFSMIRLGEEPKATKGSDQGSLGGTSMGK